MRVWEDYECKVFHDGAARLGITNAHANEVKLALCEDEAPRPWIAQACQPIPSGSGVPIGTPDSELNALVDDFADLELEKSWLTKQTPQITVDIAAFSLATYTVSKLEKYLFDLDTAPTRFDREFIRYGLDVSTLFHPADMTKLKDAEQYISWISGKADKSYRLPTEFEWEYVASGGEARKYPWGDTWCQGAANTAELGLNTTLPVFCELCDPSKMKFPIVGMAGNVEEITSSEHKPYDRKGVNTVDGFTEIDPDHRIVRGGSFTKWRDLASCQRRHSIWVGSKFGIRLVEV